MTILVTTPFGKTGSALTKLLQEEKIPYQLASRSTNIPFDWFNSSTWEGALKGVNSAYLAFHPDLAIPESKKIISEFFKVAEKFNLEKVVLLSGRGEPAAQDCENVALRSKIPTTIVRSSWFCQNFSHSFWMPGVTNGKIIIPETRTTEPFVDVDDIAEVVKVILTTEGHSGKVYEVTGPESLSFNQVSKILSDELERKVELDELDMKQFKEYFSQQGLEPQVLALLEYLFTEVLDGRNANTCNGIEEVLNRKATSFNEFVRKMHKKGCWR